uniref:Protein kinase domain-containing protein n=1 Tax=Acrobeloides nanus TaxID=290746 RepID=A0A914EI63_9BILA
MHISSEEIVEMKEKSDDFMILRKNLHVYFDVILGKGVSSTVYKGHLLGTAPLHEQQQNRHTEKFVDCDVAVKVSNRFGQSEVEELFKEIQAMKLIEYHENVVCFNQSSWAQKLPIKWLALESLTNRMFSEKSDVWSFGVLMYEMFTFGQIPYASMNNDELLVFLQSNGRLERPVNMTEELCEIMYSCWIKDMEKRPNFAQLQVKFD